VEEEEAESSKSITRLLEGRAPDARSDGLLGKRGLGMKPGVALMGSKGGLERTLESELRLRLLLLLLGAAAPTMPAVIGCAEVNCMEGDDSKDDEEAGDAATAVAAVVAPTLRNTSCGVLIAM
jgi:hypothetical protein